MKALKLNYWILVILCGLFSACEKTEPEPPQTFTLSTMASPVEGGSITVSPSSSPYSLGQNVTLSAQPNTNWVFKEWDGDASGNSNPFGIVMNSNKSVTGIFVKRDYPLNITVEGAGTVNEVIVTNSSGREYPHGTTVELTPVPDGGWIFESWGGDLSGSEVPQRITVDGEKNVTVIFKFDGDPVFYLAENGVTCKCDGVNPGEKGLINGVEYEAVDNDLLRQRLAENADMTKLCTSSVTDMSTLFFDNNFNQPIGNWDVSKVTNMEGMFAIDWPNIHPFNQEIGNWDVSKVTNMSAMFTNSNFNQPIGNWDVSNVTNMSFMFSSNNADRSSPFNQDIGGWDVRNVTTMWGMFYNSQFKRPIGEWNVSNVTNMEGMFGSSQFNQPIGDWDVSKVTFMAGMFEFSQFNQPIGEWDVSNVEFMNGMFFGSPFNQAIGNWNVSKVTEMWSMFGAWEDNIPEIKFNQPIGDWDVSNVTIMTGMFMYNKHFNQDLSKWCVDEFSSEPEDFRTGATAWVLPKPVWGTCPD